MLNLGRSRNQISSFFIVFLTIVGPEVVRAADVRTLDVPNRCEKLFSAALPPRSTEVGKQMRDVPLRARIQIALLAIGDFTVGAERFVPKVISISKGPVNQQEHRAITTSLENNEREVAYVEIVNNRGEILFRSEFKIGSKTEVQGYDLLKPLLIALKAQNLENEFVVIRDVHTHSGLSKSLFSAADIRSTFLTHALIEMAGMTKFRFEASILYSKRSNMKYEKKTMLIPESTLSYVNGDFSLGKKLDETFRAASTEELRNIGENL